MRHAKEYLISLATTNPEPTLRCYVDKKSRIDNWWVSRDLTKDPTRYTLSFKLTNGQSILMVFNDETDLEEIVNKLFAEFHEKGNLKLVGNCSIFFI